jgi:hypothetical protein
MVESFVRTITSSMSNKTNKLLWLLAALLVSIVLVSGCASQQQSETQTSTSSEVQQPQTISKQPVDEAPKSLLLRQIVIQPTEIEGYILDSRGERSRSEIAQENLNRGWKEGYFVNYKQKDGTSIIEIVMSRYPENVISALISNAKTECKGSDIGENIYGSYEVGYEILTSPFPDSIMCKATETYYSSNRVIRFYHFEFVKKDVYVYIRGEDQELIKGLANMMRERI